MNIVQHQQQLEDHEARLQKLERSLGVAVDKSLQQSSSLEEAIRKAKEQAKQ